MEKWLLPATTAIFRRLQNDLEDIASLAQANGFALNKRAFYTLFCCRRMA